MTLLVLLGLGSGLCWGTADFFGGLQSRHLPALAVALWSQVAGAIALCFALVALGEPPVLVSMAWGSGAGFFGGIALVLFYRGLAGGVMSLVAPISACGAMVPVAVAFAMGEVPGLLTSIGIAAAVSGIVLVSLHSPETPYSAGRPRQAVILALGAAIGFGMFYVLTDQGSAVGDTTPLWTIAGARIGSLITLLGLIAAGPRSAPWPGRRTLPVAAIGVTDTLANVLFAYASTQGNLGVAAVLGSLYPVATVLLGRIVLEERLAGIQHLGVGLALIGVVLVSAG